MSRSDLDLEQLIQSGEVRECAACGRYSAYNWEHVTAGVDSERCQSTHIAHIGTCSGFEWQCGHCGANNVFKDAPILAECYTHEEPPDCADLPEYARYGRQ